MRAAFLVALAGCFGAGPDITAPSEATILLALEPPRLDGDSCELGSYLGNVAIGASEAYAVTLAYQPSCSGGGGAFDASIPSRLLAFSKTAAGAPRELGTAGDTADAAGQRPRIAALPGGALWLYQAAGNGGRLTIESTDGSVGGTIESPFGFNSAGSIAFDAGHAYVAAWQPPGGPTIGTDPRYPCCGGGNGPMAPSAVLQLSLEPTATVAQLGMPTVACELVEDCLVVGADALFYFVHAIPAGGTLVTQPKANVAPTTVADLGDAPAGLVADAAHVAWSTSIDYARTSNADLRRCSIFVAPTTPPFEPRTLLETSVFSCLDLALDGDALYFTIVELRSSDPADVVENVGIGRISIATGELETLALGIRGPESGPRRIFVDGDGLIVVAPLIVARYPKTALDGRHDLAR
jgi:hypothetical protein